MEAVFVKAGRNKTAHSELVWDFPAKALTWIHSQHQSAYGLSYDVTLFSECVIVIFGGFFGISLNDSSILKRKTETEKY